MAARKKDGPSGEVETRTVSYLPAGVGVDPYQGEPTLDPDLAKIRDEEIKKLEGVPAVAPLGEPTIDEELVKARKAELERDAKRAGVNLSDTSAGKAETESQPAKKAASKKSSKK